jgi:hypothetical protein
LPGAAAHNTRKPAARTAASERDRMVLVFLTTVDFCLGRRPTQKCYSKSNKHFVLKKPKNDKTLVFAYKMQKIEGRLSETRRRKSDV